MLTRGAAEALGLSERFVSALAARLLAARLLAACLQRVGERFVEILSRSVEMGGQISEISAALCSDRPCTLSRGACDGGGLGDTPPPVALPTQIFRPQ